jgi:ABC-type Mn2+/Zn2+ transport system ATPase subunit
MLAKEQRFIERFAAHAAKAAQVQSRVKKLEKLDVVELPVRRKVVEFDFPRPPRSGEDVAMLSGVSKAYGERVLYDGFDFVIRRTERWCVMGRNGAGKTTLLKLVAGVLDPDHGSVRLGAGLKVGYFAQQSLEQLDPSLSVFEQVQHAFPMAGQGVLRNLLGAFHFSGTDHEKPVRVLSGGEKSRLVLAQMLFDPPNFLILDEPTNHLDLETKEMLVEALGNFEGTMLFVSHDRAFPRADKLNPGRETETEARSSPSRTRLYVEFVERTEARPPACTGKERAPGAVRRALRPEISRRCGSGSERSPRPTIRVASPCLNRDISLKRDCILQRPCQTSRVQPDAWLGYGAIGSPPHRPVRPLAGRKPPSGEMAQSSHPGLQTRPLPADGWRSDGPLTLLVATLLVVTGCADRPAIGSSDRPYRDPTAVHDRTGQDSPPLRARVPRAADRERRADSNGLSLPSIHSCLLTTLTHRRAALRAVTDRGPFRPALGSPGGGLGMRDP